MTSFRPHAIELDGGVVRGHAASHGYWFVVDVIEEDGGRLGIWDGPEYGVAIIEAEHARLEFGIEEPVRDVVAGGTP